MKTLYFITLFLMTFYSPLYASDQSVVFYKMTAQVDLLLKNNQFSKLNKLMKKAETAKDQFGHLVMTRFCQEIAKNKNNYSKIAKWNSSPAKSDYSQTLYAMQLIDEGWNIRGGSFVDYIAQAEMKAFKEKTMEGGKLLADAYKQNPNNPVTPYMMITVCNRLSLPRDVMELWYNRALKLDPDNKRIYLDKLFYLDPRWHGSTTDVALALQDMTKLDPVQHPVMSIVGYQIFETLFRTNHNLPNNSARALEVKKYIIPLYNSSKERVGIDHEYLDLLLTYNLTTDAKALWNQLITKSPQNYELLLQGVRLFAKDADKEQLNELLDKCDSLNPYTSLHHLKAFKVIKPKTKIFSADFRQEVANKYLKGSNNIVDTNYMLHRLYYILDEQKDHQNKFQQLEQSLKLYPNSRKTKDIMGAGLFHLPTPDYKKALVYFADGIEALRTEKVAYDVDNIYRMAFSLYQMDRYEESADLFGLFTERYTEDRSPYYYNGHFYRAISLFKINNFTDSKKYFEIAKEGFSNDPARLEQIEGFLSDCGLALKESTNQ